LRGDTFWSSALAALALTAAAGCGGGGQGNEPPTPAGAIPLRSGMTLGRAVFPIGNTPEGGQGQTIDGVPCNLGAEDYHIHLHLSLWVDGEQIAIPAGVGFKDPIEENGIVVDGVCLYELHTHDASGIIHVEAPEPRTYTLGQLFRVWGRPLETGGVAGFAGPVAVYVDGARYEGDPRGIVFADHQQIALVVGAPPASLPVYAFPSGL